MMVMPDDARGDETQFQDIGWSGSRWRITGSQEFGNGMKAGFRLEQQIQSNRSSDPDVSGAQVGGGDDADTFGLTYAALVYKGIEIFATIRELDSNVAGSTSVDILAVGSRIKF